MRGAGDGAAGSRGGYRGPNLSDQARGDEEAPVTSGWDTEGERGGDAEFPLFSPPTAWKARPVGAQELLPGHDYVLGFGHYVAGDSYNGVVEFTPEDLATLKPGQVWADDRAMSLGEFEELAEDSC